MENYSGFASVYDELMDDIPYDDWCNYLVSLLLDYQITGGLVLDLGCGTGNITKRLAKRGYDMIGVDNSEEMLMIAREKQKQKDVDILYLHQDMREFELYGTVKAVVSICDSMNYITEREDLVRVFSLVNNYLDPGGIFIFDIHTPCYYEQIGEDVIAENREDCSFIWENYYDYKTRINEYALSIFVQDEQGKYDKYEETHYQKAYLPEEIEGALSESGLQYITAYEAFTKAEPTAESKRVYVIAKEVQKTLG